jgi:hypothetical protein
MWKKINHFAAHGSRCELAWKVRELISICPYQPGMRWEHFSMPRDLVHLDSGTPHRRPHNMAHAVAD